MINMTDCRLNHIDYLPDGFLNIHAQQLHTLLPGPTLIELAGRSPQPLFLSVLLHGNEVTGLHTIQALLKKYSDRQLPRSLAIFVGNISAARHSLRRLEGQPDYNRIWPGTDASPSPETAMAREVFEIMSKKSPFASIDIHNNTGINPHYACINKLGQNFFHLATLFNRTAVYFIYPKGVQSSAFATICPSVTLECGKPDQVQGLEHALEFVDSCLHLSEIPSHPVAHNDLDLFHTVTQVKIKEQITFSYHSKEVDLFLDPDLDRMNFTELAPGAVIGECRDNREIPVIARNEQGDDLTSSYFEFHGRQLVLKKPLMPAMLTLDERVIEQDCFCYLMERIPYEKIKNCP